MKILWLGGIPLVTRVPQLVGSGARPGFSSPGKEINSVWPEVSRPALFRWKLLGEGCSTCLRRTTLAPTSKKLVGNDSAKPDRGSRPAGPAEGKHSVNRRLWFFLYFFQQTLSPGFLPAIPFLLHPARTRCLGTLPGDPTLQPPAFIS